MNFNLSPVGIISVEGVGSEVFGLHVDKSPAQLVSNVVKIANSVLVDPDQILEIKTGNDKFDYNTGKVTSTANPKLTS